MNEETFSELLREVRERAGGPALAKLAKLGAASDSTLQLLLAGQFKKAPDLDLVLNFIAACKTFAAQKKRSLPAGCADEKLWRERHLQLTAVLEDRDRQARKATTLAGGSYVLSAWPTGAARTTDGPARPTSPSALLAEASSRVPFTGREAAYQRLVAWRDEPRASPASVRLLVGPGGQGKTRLAAHFAERSTPASWTVWRARPQRLGVRTSVPARPGPQGKKALVIVDYADRWPYEYLEEMLEGLVQGRRTQLRVLLIARSDAFWHSRVHDFRSWGYTAGPPDILEGLPRGSADRALMYAAAHSAYARALGAEPAAASPSRAQLDGEAFELVLSIHMVALAAVYGHPTQHQDSLDPAELSGFLLDRERNYWQKLRDAGVITTDITTMEQATVVATLVQGLGYDDALDVLQATRVAESPGAARDILRDHALAYPPDDELTELTPLRPDRLGEDLLGQSVPSHAGRRRGQPWAALLYARLLARSPQDPPAPAPGRDPAPAAPAWTRASLEVLTAAALRWPHLTTTQIAPLLTADPAIMRHASSTTLSNLTGLADLQPSTLLAVEAALPFGDLELEPGAAELAAHLRPHLLAAAADPAGRGTVHRRIALRMTGAGRHEDALDDMQALAAILRTGRAEDPTSQALAHGLARALDSIGYHQHHLGRYADAAETTREAVEIFSSLAPSDTLIEDPGLVRALANLAGRRRPPLERLEAADRGIGLGRRFAGDDPARDGVELAGAIQNRAIALSDLGRLDEAILAIQEAVDIRTTQAERDFAGYAEYLASALNAQGILLEDSDNVPEALLSRQKATATYRRLLALNRRHLHIQLLADSLISLSETHRTLGDAPAAVATAAEAVSLWHELHESDPTRYALRHANALVGLAIVDDAGWQEHVLAALPIYRSCSPQLDPHSDGLYAASLEAIADEDRRNARWHKALEALDEIEPVTLRLLAHDPASHIAQRLTNLRHKQLVLTRMGEVEEAARVDELFAAEATKHARTIRLIAARSFHQREGHLDVPASHQEPFGQLKYQLGAWIASIRGGRETLHPKDAERLDGLGMTW